MSAATGQVKDPTDIVLAISDNPYPGLRPFLPSEEHLFFGRDLQVDGMVDKLERTRFLAVVGGSGSGKSSLVNCGLRPALSRGRMASAGASWKFAPFRPGNRPIRALAQALVDALEVPIPDAGSFGAADFIENALRSSPLGLVDAFAEAGVAPGTALLVVADQFEELFRYQMAGGSAGDAGEDAKAFVNLLVEAAAHPGHPIYVVITMRSDFLGDCAQFFGLPEAINAGQFLVPRLTRDERRRAITGPAALSGAAINPVLLTRLVNDVGDNPDQLSILQHALNRTWTRWHAAGTPEAPIDLSHYEGIGTMARALDAHAEEAFHELGEPGRQLCARVFKALTDRSLDARGTRRPTEMAKLCAIVGASFDEVAAVLEVFRRSGRAFLMPPARDALSGSTVIDISHESLMRVWERLAGWVRDESESAQAYRRIADGARLWTSHKSGLLWDPALQVALDWRQRERPNEAWGAQYDPDYAQAMAFLDESVRQRDVYQQQLKARRQRRRAAWAAVVLAGVVALAGIVRFQVQGREKDAIEQALQQVRASRLVAEAHAARTAGRIDRALLLSVAAQQVHPLEEGQDLLMRLLRTAPRLILHGAAGSRIVALAYGSGNGLLATATPEGRVTLWDTRSGRAVGGFDGPMVSDATLAFDNDGRYLVAAGQVLEGSMIWDVERQRPHVTPTRSPPQAVPDATSRAVHAGRGLVAAAGFDHRVVVWDIARSRVLAESHAHTQRPTALRFSPDGHWLASADEGGRLQLLDLSPGAGGALTVLSTGSTLAYVEVAFDADGTKLAALRADGGLDLWQLNGGHRLQAFLGQGEDTETLSTSYVAFSPDGRTVAWSGNAGQIMLADVGSDRRRVIRRARGGNLGRFAFQPGGRVIAAADQDGTVLLWDLVTGVQAGAELRGHGLELRALGFSRDGRTLATADTDTARVVLWDLSPDQAQTGRIYAGAEAMRGVAFSPDGTWVAAGGEDATVTLHRVGGPARTIELRAEQVGPLLSLAFDGEGRWLAAGADDGAVAIWDRRGNDKDPPRLLDPQGEAVTGLAFSRTATPILATASRDGSVRLRDPASGKTVRQLSGNAPLLAVSMSADGRWVAAGRRDGVVLLWDLSAGTDSPASAQSIKAHAEAVVGLAFDHSGQRLATVALDGSARVWDLVRRESMAEWQNPQAPLHSVAFAPGGRMLAVGDALGGITLWDPLTGKPAALPIRAHDGHVQALAYAADGRLLASASRDRSIAIWDADVGDWSARACRIVNRRPTEEDWPASLKPNMSDRPICRPTERPAPSRP